MQNTASKPATEVHSVNLPSHPLAQVAAQLTAPFPESDIETKPGKGGAKLRYVKAPAIIRRLNSVVGAGNWSVDVAVADADSGAVRTTLTILGVAMADFGDSNNPKGGERGVGAQVFKEAASDGLKRAARLFGIGLELWEGGATTTTPVPSPAASGRAVRPVTPAAQGQGARNFEERVRDPVNMPSEPRGKAVELDGVRCTTEKTQKGQAYKSVGTCSEHPGKHFWSRLNEQGRLLRWSHAVGDGSFCYLQQ